MKIACLGGGPGGLGFSILAAKAVPGAEVEVWDRNPPGGHGFAALSRSALVTLMQQRAADLGVTIHHETEAPLLDELSAADLIIGADGVVSSVRAQRAHVFRPSVEHGRCKFIWLAVDGAFDAFKFFVLDTPHGIVQVHGYPYQEDESTFIVEMREEVLRAFGFDR